jgi:hypothetical protein
VCKTATKQKLKQGRENRGLKPPLAYQERSCTVPCGAMERRKKNGNHSPQKNNLIQDSEGNE